MSEAVFHDYWRSSAAYRVRIALNLLGLAHRTAPVDLPAGAHKRPEYLALNPQGIVPTLEIDGLCLTQSLAIMENLHETRPEARFLPKDPSGRARVRRIAYAIAMEIHPVCNLSVAKFAVAASAGNLREQDWMQAFIPDRLAALETMLAEPQTGEFCHGNTVTMADICLLPQIFNARRWNVDLTPLPLIRSITGRLEAIEAFAAAHPDHHKPA